MSRRRVVFQRYYLAREFSAFETPIVCVRNFVLYDDGFGYIHNRGEFDNEQDAEVFRAALNDQVSEP